MGLANYFEDLKQDKQLKAAVQNARNWVQSAGEAFGQLRERRFEPQQIEEDRLEKLKREKLHGPGDPPLQVKKPHHWEVSRAYTRTHTHTTHTRARLCAARAYECVHTRTRERPLNTPGTCICSGRDAEDAARGRDIHGAVALTTYTYNTYMHDEDTYDICTPRSDYQEAGRRQSRPRRRQRS